MGKDHAALKACISICLVHHSGRLLPPRTIRLMVLLLVVLTTDAPPPDLIGDLALNCMQNFNFDSEQRSTMIKSRLR